MKAVAKKINISQASIVKILVALVMLFMFAYLYFVNSTAFGAAAYERISDQIIETQSEIGELELVFIEKNRSIEKEMGSEFGLVPADESNMIFARRNTATKLTFNE